MRHPYRNVWNARPRPSSVAHTSRWIGHGDGGHGYLRAEPESFAESTQLALARCPVSHALGAMVTIAVDANLARGT